MEKKKDEELLGEIPALLLSWYDAGARVLPWRENPEPYWVWVSEIMLQQTRVEAVKPYYERFLNELPTVADLAAAPEEQILKLWEGLGYYNRVRNMQKAAQIVMERYSGAIPASYEELRSLPGIGEYTAGAIASIAFQIPAPAVDGNVLRVISRLLCRRENILDPKVKKWTEEEIRKIIPKRAGDFNQSLMELGAMVCLPNGAPKCGECPLSSLCRAHTQGIEETLPVKAKKKPRKQEQRTVFLLTCGEKLALRRRPEKGLLAGLWELPSVEGLLTEPEAAGLLEQWGVLLKAGLEPRQESKHVFTHVEWHMTAWAAEAAREAEGFAWVRAEALNREYTLPSAFKAYFAEIGKTAEAPKSKAR